MQNGSTSPYVLRVGTHMYPDVYDRVHICTQSYMTGYIHVPGRIRQGTHMYSVVYVRVHICTLTYTSGYTFPKIRCHFQKTCMWGQNGKGVGVVGMGVKYLGNW